MTRPTEDWRDGLPEIGLHFAVAYFGFLIGLAWGAVRLIFD